MFNLALELPGNGAYRLPGSPREYSCPSDAEEQAAMYNMACAYCGMGQKEAALTCVEAALEAGGWLGAAGARGWGEAADVCRAAGGWGASLHAVQRRRAAQAGVALPCRDGSAAGTRSGEHGPRA